MTVSDQGFVPLAIHAVCCVGPASVLLLFEGRELMQMAQQDLLAAVLYWQSYVILSVLHAH